MSATMYEFKATRQGERFIPTRQQGGKVEHLHYNFAETREHGPDFVATDVSAVMRAQGATEWPMVGESWVEQGTIYQGGVGVKRMGGASASTYKPTHGGYPG